MRLPLFSLIGLGALVVAGALAWLVGLISSLTSLDFGVTFLLAALFTGGRAIALVLVAASLVWNQRLPLLVGWIVAGASALASLINFVVYLSNGYGASSVNDLFWFLGFGGAAAMGILLWLRTAPERPAQQNPWAQPQQAYAAAVQQPWGQQPQATQQPQAAQQPQATQQYTWEQPTAEAAPQQTPSAAAPQQQPPQTWQ